MAGDFDPKVGGMRFAFPPYDPWKRNHQTLRKESLRLQTPILPPGQLPKRITGFSVDKFLKPTFFNHIACG